jgi:hypothetical protein
VNEDFLQLAREVGLPNRQGVRSLGGGTNYMKNIIIIIVLLILTLNSYGICKSGNDYLSENTLKPDTDTHFYSLPKNMIYLEFLGSTQERFSLNYERTLFSIKRNYFSLRTG